MKRAASLLVGLALLVPAAPASAGQLVALATGDASCDDGSGDRYVDCGNGTITDTQTGLIWLQDASCFDQLNWRDAMSTLAGLADGSCGLNDNSSPGEWRLPSIGDWATTVAAAVLLACVNPSLTNDVGTNCFAAGGGSSFINLAAGTPIYWSATTSEANPLNAFVISLVAGNTTGVSSKNNANWLWPVRGGQ
jgi:hypothetical protein